MPKPLKQPSVAEAGREYHIAVCTWCGGPAPVWADRKGNPFSRCSSCGCRAFGNTLAMQIGLERRRISDLIAWPPQAYNPGEVDIG